MLATRFVSGVLVLTALTVSAWLLIDPSRAFPAALAVLVVSCPCAFALAVPAVTTRAIAVLARAGVLVLKPDALEKLTRITHSVFDKTGTLTRNRPELLAVRPLAHVSTDECLRIAAALEAANAHPLGRAIQDAAVNLAPLRATEVHNRPGAGVEGSISGRRYRLGHAAFALQGGGNGNDAVVLADAFGALARFDFRESLRADAQATLAALRAEGIGLEILSGDESAQVARVAQSLGVSEFRARATPASKLSRLQELRAAGAVVAVVGDGVNDAPVLAGADVAIALGDGAQLAQSSADIVLAGDRLDALVEARRIAALAERVLRQNLYWALAYNFLSIPLAALGFVPPWLAAIGMSLSSLLVVLNSLRVRAHVPAREAVDHITVAAEVAHA
jgi:Cu2+-exporting ATPase